MTGVAGGGRPAAPGAAQLPCLLVNPRSFRASRWNLAGRAARLAHRHGLQVLEASDPAQFLAAFEQLRANRQQQIWMLAGDGTVQAFAEYLTQRPGCGWSPALLPLAGGRANVVPRECGGYPAMPGLRTALARLRAGQALVEDSLTALQVSQPGARPRQGFLLAGGAIHEGVRLCSEHRERGTGWLHRSWFADPFTLLRLAFQVWTGRSPLPPYSRLNVQLGGGAGIEAPMRILLASTLKLRNALYNPFAERGEGPVRVTAVSASAERFWRHLPAMMGGRFDNNMNLAQGYLSGRCAHAEILGIAGYALDGECFAADPQQPLRLAPGITLRVLRL